MIKILISAFVLMLTLNNTIPSSVGGTNSQTLQPDVVNSTPLPQEVKVDGQLTYVGDATTVSSSASPEASEVASSKVIPTIIPNPEPETEPLSDQPQIQDAQKPVPGVESQPDKVPSDATSSVTQNYQFAYSNESNACTTMPLYNYKTLKAHSYIDCLGYLMEYLGDNPDFAFYDVRFQGSIYAVRKTDIATLYRATDIKSMPYYINDGGYVTHYIERNPVKEEPPIYISKLGYAPSWMIPGQKYFSFDGIYFQTDIAKLGKYDNAEGSINESLPYYDYYLYLPLRSQTTYTGEQLSRAFRYFYDSSSYKNKTSKMINSGPAFTEIQNNFGTNALLVMAMGVHESAYGTSQFAIERNNLFGVGAVDTDPSLAAKFDSIAAGITEQGNFLSWVYADADYPTGLNYYGSHLGNKSSGMNVKYASDPFWGEKIARTMASFDRYLGEKDYRNSDIAIVKQGATVYWQENGIQKAHTYKQSTSTQDNMYPVVLEKSALWNTIAMEPSYNANKVVGPRYPEGGKYNRRYKGFVNSNQLIIIYQNKKFPNLTPLPEVSFYS
ncbi:MAG: glucosaminidase domain-containing protein [Culicoidibacterales bacterium]